MEFHTLTLAQVKSVPKHLRHYPQNQLTKMFKEFLNSGAEAALLEIYPDEYSSIHSAYASIYNSIQYGHLPIHAEIRSGLIYLINTQLTPAQSTTPTTHTTQEAE